MEAARGGKGTLVLPDVNPNIVNVLLKNDEDMPYSGIKRASKRAIFGPLLRLLLLFKQFKLQPCELLLGFDVGLLNGQQTLYQIRFPLT